MSHLSINEMNCVASFVWHISFDDIVQIPRVHSRRESYQMRITEELRAFAIVRRLIRRVVPQH